MPATARQFGVRAITDPAQNLAGGVRYLRWLEKPWPSRIADPVVRYGHCRGFEPVAYVALILERFDHYRQFVTPTVAE